MANKTNDMVHTKWMCKYRIGMKTFVAYKIKKYSKIGRFFL